MEPDPDLVNLVTGREGWHLDGPVAVYQRPDVEAVVWVRAIPGVGHRERYRAIVIRAGQAEHSYPAGTALDAVRRAEQVPLT